MEVTVVDPNVGENYQEQIEDNNKTEVVQVINKPIVVTRVINYTMWPTFNELSNTGDVVINFPEPMQNLTQSDIDSSMIQMSIDFADPDETYNFTWKCVSLKDR